MPHPFLLDHCTFPAMIADWRTKWAHFTQDQTDPLFPFGFVMLSTWFDKYNFTCGNNPPDSCPVAAVRWGQTANYGFVPNPVMPNTFMSVAVDWGDPNYTNITLSDIHPPYKQQVAARLANAGLAVAYGYDNYWTGPIPGVQ